MIVDKFVKNKNGEKENPKGMSPQTVTYLKNLFYI